MQKLAERTPAVIERVTGKLPLSFPERVPNRVCTGLRNAAAVLAKDADR